MSLDAKYLLIYYNLPYVSPPPMALDIDYLTSKYGGNVNYIESTTIYWDKPKYTLLPEDIANLYADQVLERKDGDLWEIIK